MPNIMYRVGFIGCGRIAAAHALGYQGVSQIEMVAIADPVRSVLDSFGDQFGISNRYLDARQMLDKEDLDIVSIATWHKLHAPMTIAACASGIKAVLCEKPMATTLGECHEMITVAKRNNVKLAIAHQRRFYSAWTEARQLIAAGAIGQPRQIVCRGGQGLLNDCSHLFDLMRYVLGDPQAEWVIGNLERKTDRYEREIPIEDRSAGIVGFAGGCIGLLLQEIAGPNYQGGVVYGSDGIIDLNEQRARILDTQSSSWTDYPMDGASTHVAQAQELIDWIEDKTIHRGNAQNGLAAVEIIMAIYESARMHEVVQLPLRTYCSPLELMIESGDLPVERPGRYDIRSFLLHGEEL